MATKIIHKVLENTRLANGYGGWIYCDCCSQTIGYLCYVTYRNFKLEYSCKCGNVGSMILEVETETSTNSVKSNNQLIKIKNRLCCAEDQSPLLTVLFAKLESYHYEITCKACGKMYKEEGRSE